MNDQDQLRDEVDPKEAAAQQRLRRQIARREFLQVTAALGGAAVFGGGLSALLAACSSPAGSVGPSGSAAGSVAPSGSAAGSVAPSGSAAAATIRYFGYEPFVKPELLAPLQAKDGITVQASFFGSPSEMLGKLAAGGAKNYDVLLPINSDVQQLHAGDFVQPFDTTKLTNWAKLVPSFQKAAGVTLDGQTYMVPVIWGTDSISHDKAHIPEVDSWSVLWDSKYKGHLSMQDWALETLVMTGILLGYPDPWTQDESQLKESKAKLIEAKPLQRFYWAKPIDLQNAFVSGDVWAAQSYVSIVEPSIKAGVDMGWSFPKEGLIGFIEGTCVVKGTPAVDAVHKFTDYLIGDTYGADLFRLLGYYPTSTAVTATLTPDEQNAAKLNNPALPASAFFFKNPTNYSRWEEIWAEVKAA